MSLSEYEVDGIRYWDAVAERFVGPIARPSGELLLGSGQANLSYKRLGRVIDVPEQGATLSFSVTRRSEWGYDFFFVEAHTPGADDWTTLPDADGYATQDGAWSCSVLLALHPALASYLTVGAYRYESCLPLGTSGEWWAATGESPGTERWSVDLSVYAGQAVEVSLSYVSDEIESVVRRQPHGQRVAAHLAERGLRTVCPVALVRARGAGHRAGLLRELVGARRLGPVLERDHR